MDAADEAVDAVDASEAVEASEVVVACSVVVAAVVAVAFVAEIGGDGHAVTGEEGKWGNGEGAGVVVDGGCCGFDAGTKNMPKPFSSLLPFSSNSIDHLLSLLATGVTTSTSRYILGATCKSALLE